MIKMNKSLYRTKSMIFCALFAALIIVGTYIKLQVGPVAFTLQSLVVTFAALLLGPYRGAISVGVYILLGLIGIPVFTSGGGITSFLSPSFGFVIGFIPMVFVIGFIAKKLGTKFWTLLVASVAGLIVLYIFGLIYGYIIMNIYLAKGMPIGTLLWSFVGMFVPVDLVKCLVASALSCKLIPIIKKIEA